MGKVYNTLQEVLDRLKEIVGNTDEKSELEILHLKMWYYKIRQLEIDKEKNNYIEAGGDPLKFLATPDNLEPKLRILLEAQKAARSEKEIARHRTMADNMVLRTKILEKMETITENIEKMIVDFHNLCEQFKGVGPLEESDTRQTWKQYTQIGERFYDAISEKGIRQVSQTAPNEDYDDQEDNETYSYKEFLEELKEEKHSPIYNQFNKPSGAFTHGRIRPCPYCGSNNVRTYSDGSAECNHCGGEYNYA